MEITLAASVSPEELFPLICQLDSNITYDRFARQYAQILALGHYHLVTARDAQGTLCGVAGLWDNVKFFTGHFLEIDNFIIDKDHRGQGIGKRMMEFVIEYGKREGFDSIALDVFQANEYANALYDAYGFEAPGFHRVLWLNDSIRREHIHSR